MKLYDRNRNPIQAGLRVMIAENGTIDSIKATHANNMGYFEAEHAKCVELQHSKEKFAPIELIKLG